MIAVQPVFLLIVLGQPSTGKTALVNKVLDETFPDEAKKYNSLRLNLRGTLVDSRDSLFRVLRAAARRADSSVWAPLVVTLSKLIRVQVDVKQIGGIQVQNSDSTELDIEDEFSSLIDKMPMSTGKPCVLVIDEANELKNLAQYDQKVSNGCFQQACTGRLICI
jgi:Cdc6-like AAA superfamily ATPase